MRDKEGTEGGSGSKGGRRREEELESEVVSKCIQQSHKKRAPLQSMKASYPMQRVAVDIAGPFPQTAKGNLYVLVAADYFTRWVEAYAVPNHVPATEEPAERWYPLRHR